MPVPVSPLLPRRTSRETTLGRILAATAATDPSGRCTEAPVPDVGAPSVTCDRCVVVRSAWCTTRPLMAPPSTAATAVARTSTVDPGTGCAPGGRAGSSLTPPLWTHPLCDGVA